MRACVWKVAIAAAAIPFAVAASAQEKVPHRERPEAYERGGEGRQQRTYEPGVFDYYSLALSWSPTYCAGVGEGRADPQCQPRDGRRYAFVLHGLWPQFEHRWPQFCQSPDNGWVPDPVAQRMLDIMPSKRLVFHEYRKHGTCSGLGVEGYFDLARRMHDTIKVPPRYLALDDDRLFVGVDELKREFMAANPKLTADMFVVECGGPGPRLKEVRVCFKKDGTLRACGRNEDQRRLCSAERVYVPPVRVGAAERREPEKRNSRPNPQQNLLPGPR
jgi:ribonuclease T2